MSGSIKGLDKLLSKLGNLGVVAEQATIKAVRQGAEIGRAGAVLMCPVNDGELRQSIKTMVEVMDDKVVGAVYTNKKYAAYVEFGTGPKGEADHAGISPEVSPSYSQSPWWIHESQIDKATAEKYHMFAIETKDGIFYQSTGQAAQPFLYPGFKNAEQRIKKQVKEVIKSELGKACKS